jgi:hypothetical protein
VWKEEAGKQEVEAMEEGPSISSLLFNRTSCLQVDTMPEDLQRLLQELLLLLDKLGSLLLYILMSINIENWS